MNKTGNTLLFLSLITMIIFGILAILKLGCNHNRIVENAGKKIDDKLNEFGIALDKVAQFVQHTINQTP
jgi:hypothetical protein